MSSVEHVLYESQEIIETKFQNSNTEIALFTLRQIYVKHNKDRISTCKKKGQLM